MDMPQFTNLTNTILGVVALLAMFLGVIAHRTHFCTMGAVSDIVNMGDWTRMRQWILAIGVAMVGVGLLVYGGQLDLSKTIYASNRWLWLSALTGGGMFGFGMVLASGCGSKTLVRIGSGSLKSMVVFLVIGISAFATMRGVTAVARVATVDTVAVEFSGLANVQSLFSACFGTSFVVSALVCALILGGVLIAWALADRNFWQWSNLVAGFGVGCIVVAVWWVSGAWGFVPEHPTSLEEVFVATNSGRAEALSFVAPFAYSLDWIMFFSDKNKVLSLGIVAVAGVVLGACISSRLDGSFRWEGFGGVEDVANHLVGGVLMGVGGVTAMGCTVGQGLSGISTLSLTSVTAVCAIVFGAVLALRYQSWRLERLG